MASDKTIWRHLRPTRFEGLLIPDEANTPGVMARMFAGLDSDEQAAFFNEIAKEVSEWEKLPVFQWRYMQDKLTPKGKQLLKDFYEHTTDDLDAAEANSNKRETALHTNEHLWSALNTLVKECRPGVTGPGTKAPTHATWKQASNLISGQHEPA